jgi:aspartyl-tRNA(Asn)/glutamyl-tRNA(Gln) amidotransferase subunit A
MSDMVTTKSELSHLPITAAAELIKTREISPVELMKSYLERIEKFDSKVRAFTHMEDGLLEAAKKAEGEIAAGDYRGPLHGIAFTAKDQLDSEGAPSSMRGPSAGMYDSDATPIVKMKEAGAIYMGKVVMSGMDPVTAPQPRNPWNLDHGCGGSSSGSGASVAAGFTSASLGEDSAGSIRGPASFGNLVGVIGTYGRVSQKGLATMGWTLDHCGPITHSVEDAALILEAISGYDPADKGTVRIGADFTSELKSGIKGMVIGVPRKYISERDVQPDMMAGFEESLAALKSLGATIKEIEVPHLEFANVVSMVMFSNEQFAANFDHLYEWLETQPRMKLKFLALGALTSGPDYLQSQRYRAFLRNEFKKVMSDVSVIATPSQETTAPKYGDPMKPLMWMTPSFSAMFSILGLPAMSVPGGFDSKGLPFGLQLAAGPFDEATMLKAAYAYEQATPWHKKVAPLGI